MLEASLLIARKREALDRPNINESKSMQTKLFLYRRHAYTQRERLRACRKTRDTVEREIAERSMEICRHRKAENLYNNRTLGGTSKRAPLCGGRRP